MIQVIKTTAYRTCLRQAFGYFQVICLVYLMAIFASCELRLEVSCLVGTNCHLVYIGDNLHSLKLLEKTHAEKIDVI